MTLRNMPNSDRIRTCCIPNVNHSLSATPNAYPVSDDINLHWHSKCCCPLNIELKAMDKTPECMHFSNHLSFLKNWWPPLLWRCCFINGPANLHSCLQKKGIFSVWLIYCSTVRLTCKQSDFHHVLKLHRAI